MDTSGDHQPINKFRKYFLVYNSHLQDFEKIYFRDQSESTSEATSSDSSHADSDNDKPSKTVSIIKRPGCVTIELLPTLPKK